MKQPFEKLAPLAIKDFARKIISDGHLYLRSGDSRNFYLMKPGVFIDPAFIKKHAATQTVFGYDQVTNPEDFRKYTVLFKEWKYLQFEKDFRLKSAEIISQFLEIQGRGAHFLNFALACFDEFNIIPHDKLLKMHEADLHLFQKALYSSAFAVLVAIGNDFYHYPMVKDFYNLTMCLDVGLCESNYTYFVAEACNRENQNPGTGKAWMISEGASEQEIKVFHMHPEHSHHFLKSSDGLLSYPELAEVALYQHELANGKGFPRGISKGQVSSWEAIVILADSMVEIKDEHEFESDVLSFIGSFKNKKLYDLPVQRVFKKLCLALNLNSSVGEEAG